jgi:hypothetical protein
MDLHPGPEKRRVPAVKLAELEPIRRALQDNADWYEDVVEHSHDLLCIHDLAGRLGAGVRLPVITSLFADVFAPKLHHPIGMPSIVSRVSQLP